MSRRPTSKFTWAVLLLIVSAVLWFAWEMFLLHVDEPAGPVSAARAHSFASIPIPATATNIRIAGFHQGVQFEKFVRFEAPTAVCLKTAAEILPDEKLVPVDPYDASARGALPLRKGVFRDFDWFDLPKATHLVSAGGGPSNPEVWVDQDRGVFYYRLSD